MTKGMRRYAHIGTGNYNASSAKIYTDLGLFTARDDICSDVQDLFNVMTGFGVIDNYRRIFVSPNHLRANITRLIREEAEIHRAKGGGRIIMKCNQLVDQGIVRELYEASRAGAAHGATMVIFLSIGLVDKVQNALLQGGAYTPDTPAAVVYKATWPEQKTVRCTVGSLAQSVHDAGITKTALIVAGDFLGTRYERSKLYDPGFTTEFRKGSDQ